MVSVPVSLALATGASAAVYAPLVVLATVTYGALFTPAFSLVSDGAEHAGLAQGMAFGLLNAAWAAGAMVGPAVAGAIAARPAMRSPSCSRPPAPWLRLCSSGPPWASQLPEDFELDGRLRVTRPRSQLL